MGDKTLVEMLREVDYGHANHTHCQIADALGIRCEGKTCDECGENMAHRLADAIEREYLPRPQFEDGEPVQFGDKFESSNIVGTVDYILKGNVEGCVIGRKEDCACVMYPNGKRLQRPKQEVLDADGLPIRVGDTVWAISEHIIKGPMIVTAVEPGMVSYKTEYGAHGNYYTIGEITHKEPDSLERIDKDAGKLACEYFNREIGDCENCKGFGGCREKMLRDLLRRQRKLLENK